MNWLQKIAFPFEEHELMYGPDSLYNEEEEQPEDDFSDLPECPQTLLIVDVQEEFNQCIYFNCHNFLRYLKKCYEFGTEFHVIYDELGKPPSMFSNLGSIYYAKSYGADPYKGVIDKRTGKHIDASEMKEDVLYYDPNSRLDIFVSSGHEYQHVYPDMIELVRNVRGKQILMVGGAENECLRDMMHWLDLNHIEYNMLWQFVY